MNYSKSIRNGLLSLAVILTLLVALVVYLAYIRTMNAGLTFTNPLHIPPILEPTLEGDTKVFELEIANATHQFFAGQDAATQGYNGTYLGPTIKVKTGDNVRFNIVNTLDEVTTVHWHGMHVPPEMDGTPHQPIMPGATWHPHYEIKNEASTMWYHPHTHGGTARQSYFGLAGLYIIEDENSASLDIPQTYGVDDIPVILQDRLFDDSGDLVYGNGGNAFLGDTILINGTHNPYVTVDGKLIRFRILNASNARIYRLAFSDGREFHQIATDGGLLETPVALDMVKLAPGERAEIVVDLSDDTDVTLVSLPDPSVLSMFENAFENESGRFDLLKIAVTPTETVSAALPAVLNVIERWDEADAARVRPMQLAGPITDGSDRVIVGQGRQIPINGKLMDMARVDAVVTLGDIEVWEVTNAGGVPHPFHVHDIQFLVLDRDGTPPPLNERGWKDTTLVNAGETVRIIAKYTDFANENVPYMFHCHIMEHEDNGMMGQFTVVAPDSDLVGSDGYMLDLDLHAMEH